MKNLLALAAAFSLAFSPVAHAFDAYIATTGDDKNNCTQAQPCYSPQRCIQSFYPRDGWCKAADGTYTVTTTADVQHHGRVVGFEGNCADPSAVKITTSGGINAFVVQDFAVFTVKCLEASAPGAAAFVARQLAIGDAQSVRFGVATHHVIATEIAKVNVANPVILNGAANFAESASGSRVFIGGSVWLNTGMTFTHFVRAEGSSGIVFSGATFTGPGVGAVSGYSGMAGNWGSYVQAGGLTIPGNAGWENVAGGGQLQ